MRPMTPRAPYAPVHAHYPDPAPSRLSYRAQRLWLTPVFRSLLYVGLPIVFLVLIAWGALNDADERARLMDRLNTLRSSIENNPEFQITTLQIDGVSAVLEGQIEYALNFDFRSRLYLFALRNCAIRSKICPP